VSTLKHIAIDMDDVLLAFVDGVCVSIARDYGVKLTENDITDWDMSKVLNSVIGEDWWDWMRRHVWLWGEKFKPMPGALGGVERLRAEGHYLEVVTSKPDWAEAQVWVWLGRYRPPVHRVTVIGMGERKVDRTEADVLIDDKPENCFQFVEDGRQAILFDRPHNQGVELRPGMDRVFDWRGMPTGLEMLSYEEATA
jgi:5'(3')-deoxyribonucleotidase